MKDKKSSRSEIGEKERQRGEQNRAESDIWFDGISWRYLLVKLEYYMHASSQLRNSCWWMERHCHFHIWECGKGEEEGKGGSEEILALVRCFKEVLSLAKTSAPLPFFISRTWKWCNWKSLEQSINLVPSIISSSSMYFHSHQASSYLSHSLSLSPCSFLLSIRPSSFLKDKNGEGVRRQRRTL